MAGRGTAGHGRHGKAWQERRSNLKNDHLIEVLESLKDEAGLIKEETVVDYARPDDSPLHPEFEWDNGVAGDRYRLLQATELIHRVHVKVETAKGESVFVRAFVSLATDRLGGGGYRPIHDVLSDVELHAELLKTALAELGNLQRRFRDLQELAPVFKAVNRAVKRHAAATTKEARA